MSACNQGYICMIHIFVTWRLRYLWQLTWQHISHVKSINCPWWTPYLLVSILLGVHLVTYKLQFFKTCNSRQIFPKKTLKAAVLSKWNLILIRVATKNYNSYPENGVFHNSRSQAIKYCFHLRIMKVSDCGMISNKFQNWKELRGKQVWCIHFSSKQMFWTVNLQLC